MKTILLTIFLCLHLAASAAEAPAKLVLSDGITYESVKVTHVEPDGLRIIHSSGATKIPYERLSEETRKIYGFDAEKAAAFRRSVAMIGNSNGKDGQAAALKEITKALTELGIIAGNNGGSNPLDLDESRKSLREAAERGNATAQSVLGMLYISGAGAAQDFGEAVTWARKAAEQGNAMGQVLLAACYDEGEGVPKNKVESYKWLLLAAGQGDGPGREVIKKEAKAQIAVAESQLTGEQIAEGQKLARNFNLRKTPEAIAPSPGNDSADLTPKSSGTGFFITEDGFLITNKHVVEGSRQVRLSTSKGLIDAQVIKVDAANDLALLKAEGTYPTLPVTTSRGAKLGASVSTVGFPNIGMQGLAPKLAKGEIASLTGASDDARYFQISVPLQPGNSGGALVDEQGNVVGVVSAKLNASVAFNASGSLPENVNYAVKSSFLLSFLEAIPKVSEGLKEPNSKVDKFENIVKSTEQAAVLVLVY